MTDDALLEVRDLDIRFGAGSLAVHAVRGVSLSVAAGECLALVGGSGSGKSAVARAIVGLAGDSATVTSTRLRFGEHEMSRFRAAQWRAVRGRGIGLVPQDALASLDPLRTVGAEVAEPLLAHKLAGRDEVLPRVTALLADTGLPAPHTFVPRRPHTLSGGQHQRVLIASAMAAGPELLIADEPTTALDVRVRAQVLALLTRRKAAGTAVLLISHDLAVVARLADRIAVMNGGVIVEQADTARLLTRPDHPYTQSLLDPVRARVPAARRPAARPDTAALELRAVGKKFRDRNGETLTAVSAVSFSVRPGEIVGLVGESGSGKTTTARIAAGLTPADSGTVLLGSDDVARLPTAARRIRQRDVQLVHQDPFGSFDPRWDVGRVVGEALAAAKVARPDRADRLRRLLDQVGLGELSPRRRPRELSGGERQRVAIARALASRPRVLVCDEPISALDAVVQEQVLRLLASLADRLGLAVLLISHDLAAVRRTCDRVVVMHEGGIVEQGTVEDVFDRPVHAHTQELLTAALPPVRTDAG
jgi:peptide/nickel transport system ATP-binding protein